LVNQTGVENVVAKGIFIGTSETNAITLYPVASAIWGHLGFWLRGISRLPLRSLPHARTRLLPPSRGAVRWRCLTPLHWFPESNVRQLNMPGSGCHIHSTPHGMGRMVKRHGTGDHAFAKGRECGRTAQRNRRLQPGCEAAGYWSMHGNAVRQAGPGLF
jgi:hypothetical protein